MRIRFNPAHDAYSLWDTGLRCYVNKFGEPDEGYYCTSREVAVMRRRDLNQYRADDAARNVTDGDDLPSWEMYRGDEDARQRYRLYRLCSCQTCDGTGKVPHDMAGFPTSRRCPDCRGEGKVRELVATAGTPEAVGVALVTLGREGEWDECPIGILDSEGEVGQKWIVKPWLPSTRNVSDAGRLLRTQRPDLAGSEIRKKADRR